MLGKKPEISHELNFHSCQLLNVSVCEHSTNNKRFVVTIYNPSSQPINTFIRVPVTGSLYSVIDFSGQKLVTQILPIPKAVLNIPGRNSSALNDLVFEAVNVGPLGHQSFYISENESGDEVALTENYAGKVCIFQRV